MIDQPFMFKVSSFVNNLLRYHGGDRFHTAMHRLGDTADSLKTHASERSRCQTHAGAVWGMQGLSTNKAFILWPDGAAVRFLSLCDP